MNIATETLVSRKAIEQEIGCKFIRTYTDKENFDILRAINEIFRHIKQLTKTTLINIISRRILGLEFKSKAMKFIKSMKFIVKKILSDYK